MINNNILLKVTKKWLKNRLLSMIGCETTGWTMCVNFLLASGRNTWKHNRTELRSILLTLRKYPAVNTPNRNFVQSTSSIQTSHMGHNKGLNLLSNICDWSVLYLMPHAHELDCTVQAHHSPDNVRVKFPDISLTVPGTPAHVKCYSYHAGTSVIVSGGVGMQQCMIQNQNEMHRLCSHEWTQICS